mmetsp:Transcript_72423/g.132250  ORF Transcript_72423/g.132250 Transcript_72423/m.132250 type:complete len:210 (+) Transcript_72423:388-1017(+)
MPPDRSGLPLLPLVPKCRLPECRSRSLQPFHTDGQKQTLIEKRTTHITSKTRALLNAGVGLPNWKSRRRNSKHRFTNLQKKAPSKPIIAAMMPKVNNSQISNPAFLSGNSMKPPPLRPVNPFLISLATTAAIIVPKNACQVKVLLQNVEASSKLKRIPPMGAPNAAATPMAAPWEMNSQRLRWPLRIDGHGILEHCGPSAIPEATIPPR